MSNMDTSTMWSQPQGYRLFGSSTSISQIFSTPTVHIELSRQIQSMKDLYVKV